MTIELPSRARVVIIGGGIIGTSVAFHLAQAGVTDVVLLESDQLGSGSTCKAAGGIRASFSTPENIAMGLRGLEVFSTFAQEFDQEVDFRRWGYLYLLSDLENMEIFTESVAIQNAHGVPSRMIDPDEAKLISPMISTEGLLGASWSPGDGKATPEAAVAGYAAAARREGARLITGCRVTGIESSGGVISGVRTSAGTIATDTVVCAAGAWSRAIGDMVGVSLPVTPRRRQIAFTGPIEGIPRVGPLSIDFPSTFYFHPEGEGILMGWANPDEPAGFNLEFDLEGWFAGFADVMALRAPALLDCGIQGGWAGLYEDTPDHNQIIGRSVSVPGFLYATGYSGHGFQMGPATGEIIRDLYLGREPSFDIACFDVRRFDRVATEHHEHNIV
jgi:sarcosine oxidase, subunit beta